MTAWMPLAVGAERLHRVQRRLEDAVAGAAPAGMGGADHPGLVIGEQDRLAIGGQHGDGEAGRGRDHARRRAGGRPAGAVTVQRVGGMDLMDRDAGDRAATPIASATRARLIATASVRSLLPGPQFSPAKMPDEAPPLRVKKPWRTGESRSEVMISQHQSNPGGAGHRGMEGQRLEHRSHFLRVGQAAMRGDVAVAAPAPVRPRGQTLARAP